MKKYNLSRIMKKAWTLVKDLGMTMSSALKQAWAEAKSLKAQLIQKLEMLAEIAAPIYNYNVVVKDWENYGKSRTYFSVVETRDNSRHYVKYDCGYFDNIAEKYVAGKHDLESNFTLSGARL